jgi:GntR family transcriptional regulator
LFIVLSSSSPDPLYKQVTDQIRDAIATGDLAAGDKLPSIRELGKELNVSLITIKRAYQDLEAQGYIITRHGLGCFVDRVNLDDLRTKKLRELERKLTGLLRAAGKHGISKDDVIDLLNHIEEA